MEMQNSLLILGICIYLIIDIRTTHLLWEKIKGIIKENEELRKYINGNIKNNS